MKEKPNLIITPDKYAGNYSNIAFVSFSPTEFLVDFAVDLPGTAPMLVNRVVMNPACAKLLAKAITAAVEDFEKNNGEITIPSAGGSPDDIRTSEGTIRTGSGKGGRAS